MFRCTIMASIHPGRTIHVHPTHPAILLQSRADDPLQRNAKREYLAKAIPRPVGAVRSLKESGARARGGVHHQNWTQGVPGWHAQYL